MDPYQPAGAFPPVEQKTSGMAITSLILGILAWVCCSCVTGIPAIICGHIARAKTSSDARVGGGGIALAGLILGYLNLLAIAIIIPISVLAIGVDGIKDMIGASQVRNAAVAYAKEHDGNGPETYEALVASGKLSADDQAWFTESKSTVTIEPFTSETSDDTIVVRVISPGGRVVTATKGGALDLKAGDAVKKE